MKKYIMLCLFLGGFITKVISQSRPEIQLNLKLNNDRTRIQLLNARAVIQPDGNNTPVSFIDLQASDLIINVTGFTAPVLVKIVPVDNGLSCQGIDAITDTTQRSLQIPVRKGIVLLDEEMNIGSVIRIVLPGARLTWTINTNIPALPVCPELTKKEVTEKIDAFKVGIPVYDAMLLRNTTDTRVVEEILKFYTNLADSSKVNGKRIADSLKGNVFLQDFIEKLAKDTLARSHSKQGALSSIFSLSSLGGLDVTNIADGLAKFLVKRTKQELNIAFFDKFKKFISKYPDLQTIFPQTYKALTVIGDEIYNYEGYIQTLRQCFEKDLRTLDKNLPGIIDNHKNFFKAHPDLAATLRSGCYVAGALEDKVHPGDILKDYPDNCLNSLKPSWKGAIQTLQLFSASLRDTAKNTDSVYWVGSKQIKALLSDDIAFKIYLGLIYQQVRNKPGGIHFTVTDKDINLLSLLDSVGNHLNADYPSYKEFILQFSEKANKLSTMINQYKKPENDSLVFEQYYNYFNASIDLLQHCTSISNLKYFNKIVPGLQDSLKDYFNVARAAADLVIDVKRRNYASAIVNVVYIYDLVKSKHQNKTNAPALTKEQKKQMKDAANDASKNMITLVKNARENNSQILKADVNSILNKKETDLSIPGKPKEKQEALSDKQKEELNKKIADYLLTTVADSTFLANIHNIKSFEDLKKYIPEDVQSGIKADVENEIHEITDDTLHKLYKYGTFMATMVEAKSSDDVEKAIEAFALPTGSARIKRESPFNVSLNAYTGLFAGYEHIKGVDNNCAKFNSYGVTAPVGIAISKGHWLLFWPMKKAGWSTSLFVSLIDVGSVAAFRFKDDSTVISNGNTKDTLATAQVPAIQLKNIISPGVFLSIGIPKCPLSVNFGVQMGGNLRKITSSNNSTQLDYSDKIYWRYSISLCVDIPILNFYTKSK